ncbi:HAD family hydrolase [Gracilibacillus xinjiangensis]|uniref:HAD family hydrolase n=1 Tax=Gracilibacillus xinjiangensis TaxID=1193282 RepID=A0ABV8WVB4_9BACI
MGRLIFDLDGTIWDPIDTVLNAWNSCIKEYSQIKKELSRADFEETMGLHMQDIGRKLFPDLSEGLPCNNLLQNGKYGQRTRNAKSILV